MKTIRILKQIPMRMAEATRPARGGGGGPVRTRADAIKKLQEVVDFLRRTEPHSPVAYLVQRAIKWAHQPFESVLSELVKDSSVLESIEDVVGIHSAGDDD